MRINPVSAQYKRFEAAKKPSFGLEYINNMDEDSFEKLKFWGVSQGQKGIYFKAYNELRKMIEEHPILKNADAYYTLNVFASPSGRFNFTPRINSNEIFFWRDLRVEDLTNDKIKEKIIKGFVKYIQKHL